MHAATTDALARALGTIVRDVEADFQRQLAVFRAERDAVVAEFRADLAEARQQRDALAIELRDLVAARLTDVKDGADGRDGRNGIDGKDGKDGEQGPQGEPGPAGRDGKDGIDGKDGADGREGEVGPAGRSIMMRGTFDPEAEYSELDVVMLGGSSFVAVKDAPGECPGGGWQLLASRGSRGDRGERGLPGRDGVPGKNGERGEQGPAGEEIAAFYKDGDDLVITTETGREHRLVKK